jgi:cytochrome c oxidase cbb3-type subunit 3
VLDKGMPAWERTLGAERVKAATAYVLTLKGTEVKGKDPQGVLVE